MAHPCWWSINDLSRICIIKIMFDIQWIKVNESEFLYRCQTTMTLSSIIMMHCSVVQGWAVFCCYHYRLACIYAIWLYTVAFYNGCPLFYVDSTEDIPCPHSWYVGVLCFRHPDHLVLIDFSGGHHNVIAGFWGSHNWLLSTQRWLYILTSPNEVVQYHKLYKDIDVYSLPSQLLVN